jgi:hypothetical protein
VKSTFAPTLPGIYTLVIGTASYSATAQPYTLTVGTQQAAPLHVTPPPGASAVRGRARTVLTHGR